MILIKLEKKGVAETRYEIPKFIMCKSDLFPLFPGAEKDPL